jgi:RNA polymerase sigma-70 factor, ECF subfamily
LSTALAEVAILGPTGELERLFHEHHGMVFRTAYRVTGNASDAEDVLQTVFLRLAGRNPSAPPLENSESYLRRASINAALDIVRGRHPGAAAPLDHLPDGSPDRSPANSLAGRTAPDRNDLRECLRLPLSRLNPQEAEVFALRYLEGHTNSEVARATGRSQVWVAVTLHRARRRLQREIQSYLGGK